MKRILPALIGACAITAYAGAQSSYVNWESAHVHPIDVSPNGEWLAVVNTADDRVELFHIDGAHLDFVRSIGVGLDPVTVRFIGNGVLCAACNVSDSVIVADVTTGVVVLTVPTGDEPADIIVAQNRAFISVSGDNRIEVYDLPFTEGAVPTIIPIEGENPRGLATNGTTVFAAIFNAGNGTTVLHNALVTNPDNNPYPGDPNPPPNNGDLFDPPINPALLVDDDGDGEPDITVPRSGMILFFDRSTQQWFDQNLGSPVNWSAEAIANTGSPVPFWTPNLHGVAHIDATTLAVTYTTEVLTQNMAIDVNPVDGSVAVVGIEAHNVIRFEPNLTGSFLSVAEVGFSPSNDGGPDAGSVARVDANPHLADFINVGGVGAAIVAPVPPDIRDQTLGDPRGVTWSPDGSYKIITGRGSNNIVKTDPNGVRLELIEVGQGPTGVVFHPTMSKAFVLNHFEATISEIDLDKFQEDSVTALPYDPTPQVIKDGRPHFYDTHKSSQTGLVSCQSCHTDGAQDQLAWDLGDPSGDMKEFNQVCLGGGTLCDDTDWHPMKGPMTTQTLIGLDQTEPFHWRGDREDLAAFNPAFVGLLGGAELTDPEMAEFDAFVDTLTFPPNPFRDLDGSLPASFPNGGDPQNGEFLFVTGGGGGVAGGDGRPDMIGHFMPAQPRMGGGGGIAGGGGFGCAGCHALPTGTNSEILRPFISDSLPSIHHLTKTAQLRNIYRKDGFDAFAPETNRCIGYLHDGALDTIQTFLLVFFPGMTLQQRLDIEAFLFSFGTDTHAGVGTQVTLNGAAPDNVALRDQMIAIAETGAVGLIMKGLLDDELRGAHYLGSGLWQTDRDFQVMLTSDLDTALASGAVLTYTMVPLGTEIRLGVDRDGDGFFDTNEEDACTLPSNPADFPGSGFCRADLTGPLGVPDGEVNTVDLLHLLSRWGSLSALLDLTCIGVSVGTDDLLKLLSEWGQCD